MHTSIQKVAPATAYAGTHSVQSMLKGCIHSINPSTARRSIPELGRSGFPDC